MIVLQKCAVRFSLCAAIADVQHAYLYARRWKPCIKRVDHSKRGSGWFSNACSSNGTVRFRIPLRYRLIWVFLVIELCCCADRNHQGQLIMQKIHLRSHLLHSVVCFFKCCVHRSFYIALSLLLFWAYCLTGHTYLILALCMLVIW